MLINVKVSNGLRVPGRIYIQKTFMRAAVFPEGETMILDGFRARANKVEHVMANTDGNTDGKANITVHNGADIFSDLEKVGGWTRVR